MLNILNIYRIPTNSKGHIAIISRPKGDDFLTESIEYLKKEEINIIISTLEKEEEVELGLNKEEDIVKNLNLIFLRFPIEDRGVPISSDHLKIFCKDLAIKILEGNSIGIHCRAGIGRSSILVACTMAYLGFNSEEALKLISQKRNLPCPDTLEQEQWIKDYFNSLERTTIQKTGAERLFEIHSA